MKYLILLMMLISFVGCSTSPPWVTTSHTISDDFIQDMGKCGWQVYGTGGGMMNDIKSVSLSFQTRYTPDISMARAIFVYSMEDLLDRYNSSESARPYLHNFPFTNKNIDLSLRFLALDGGRPPEGLVTYVTNFNGIVMYCSFDPDPNNVNELKVLLKEPYEEALRIILTEGLPNLTPIVQSDPRSKIQDRNRSPYLTDMQESGLVHQHQYMKD